MFIEAELEGDEMVERELRKVSRRIATGLVDSEDVEDYADKIRDKARSILNRRVGKYSTGKLARSLDTTMSSKKRAKIFSNVWYAEYVERKTGPASSMVSMPVWSKSKSSYGGGGGRLLTFTHNRKGYQGYRFIRGAMRWAASKLGDYIVRDVRDHITTGN